MKNYFSVSGIARLVAAALLIWALEPHSYGYYKLLRWVVCGTGVYSAIVAIAIDKMTWVWIFGITAVLFNPIIPIHLSRDVWAVIDIVVAGVFVVSTFVVLEKPKEKD